LPLSVSELDEIRAPATPGVNEIGFHGRGLLQLATRFSEAPGLEVYAEAVGENATGDPGPFLYTDSTAQNVDKLGTGYALGVAGRWGPLATSVGFKQLIDIVTDEGLRDRLTSLRDPSVHHPAIRTHAPWAALRIDHEGGRHVVRAGHSVREDYSFLPVLGHEVPTEMRLWHVGAAGDARLGGSLRWRYRAHSTVDRLVDVPNDLDLAYDLRTSRRGLAAEVVREGAALLVSLGGGVDFDKTRSRFLPAPVARRTVRTQASVRTVWGGTRVGVRGEVLRTGGELGNALSIEGEVAGPLGAHARLGAWLSRSPSDDVGEFWALYDAGYSFLDSLGITVREIGGGVERGEEGIALEVRWSARGSLEVVPFLRITRARGVTVAQPTFVLEGPLPAHDGPVALTRSAAGSALTSGVQLRLTPHRNVHLEARYRWVDALSGDSFYRAAWGQAPTHRYWQKVAWTLRSDLRLAWGLDARSGTHWPAYMRTGRGRLSGSLVHDVSLEKALLAGRLRVYGRVADLTDSARPLHPLGAAPGLTFTLSGAMRVGR
jgi:hypothetical protein